MQDKKVEVKVQVCSGWITCLGFIMIIAGACMWKICENPGDCGNDNISDVGFWLMVAGLCITLFVCAVAIVLLTCACLCGCGAVGCAGCAVLFDRTINKV